MPAGSAGPVPARAAVRPADRAVPEAGTAPGTRPGRYRGADRCGPSDGRPRVAAPDAYAAPEKARIRARPGICRSQAAGAAAGWPRPGRAPGAGRAVQAGPRVAACRGPVVDYPRATAGPRAGAWTAARSARVAALPDVPRTGGWRGVRRSGCGVSAGRAAAAGPSAGPAVPRGVRPTAGSRGVRRVGYRSPAGPPAGPRRSGLHPDAAPAGMPGADSAGGAGPVGYRVARAGAAAAAVPGTVRGPGPRCRSYRSFPSPARKPGTSAPRARWGPAGLVDRRAVDRAAVADERRIHRRSSCLLYRPEPRLPVVPCVESNTWCRPDRPRNCSLRFPCRSRPRTGPRTDPDGRCVHFSIFHGTRARVTLPWSPGGVRRSRTGDARPVPAVAPPGGWPPALCCSAGTWYLRSPGAGPGPAG